MLKVIDVEYAVESLRNHRFQLETCEVSIEEAEGRKLAEDVVSPCNVPHFKRSCVDGYAVKSSDVKGASESMPVILNKVEEVHMGFAPKKRIWENQCSYVPTGGMISEGADSVVMIENTDAVQDNEIIIYESISPLTNVISVGEDIEEEETLFYKDRVLTPYDIAVLASVGITSIKVYEKIKVGIISTGDEIVEHSQTPSLGEIRDINSHLLRALLKKARCDVSFYGIVKDSFMNLRKTLETAVYECDIVLISGGSSLGEKDFTIRAIASMKGVNILCHGIAVKPGKPTIIATVQDKAIFGLPGNPLAVTFIYKSIVEKFIHFNNGSTEDIYYIPAEFTINYHKAKGREEFIPVKLFYQDGKTYAEPIMAKSNVISCMSKAHGYISISKNLEGIHKGESVKVMKI